MWVQTLPSKPVFVRFLLMHKKSLSRFCEIEFILMPYLLISEFDSKSCTPKNTTPPNHAPCISLHTMRKELC